MVTGSKRGLPPPGAATRGIRKRRGRVDADVYATALPDVVKITPGGQLSIALNGAPA